MTAIYITAYVYYLHADNENSTLNSGTFCDEKYIVCDVKVTVWVLKFLVFWLMKRARD